MKCVSHVYQNYPEGGNFPKKQVWLFTQEFGDQKFCGQPKKFDKIWLCQMGTTIRNSVVISILNCLASKQSWLLRYDWLTDVGTFRLQLNLICPKYLIDSRNYKKHNIV